MPQSSDSSRLLALAQTRPLLRTRDVAAEGIHTGTLTRLARAGALERVGPGRYRLATSDATERHSLVLACSIVPTGAVCLSTALLFHNIGTQLPREVWLAVRRGTRVPSFAFPPVRVTRIAPELFDLGIEEHRIEGGVVRVYSVARTVVDCFRFRNKVGLDVAMEALIEARRSRRLDLNEIDRVAKALRVDRVMRPYLEMLVA
jgi:predicted transcriptional regulator of viral defense system